MLYDADFSYFRWLWCGKPVGLTVFQKSNLPIVPLVAHFISQAPLQIGFTAKIVHMRLGNKLLGMSQSRLKVAFGKLDQNAEES